ncbi:MAG: hypothetical protein ACRDM1_05160 [Gaiellaceae bacterium]
MSRPIWSGSISFGLVSLPVRMFTATEGGEVVDLTNALRQSVAATTKKRRAS